MSAPTSSVCLLYCIEDGRDWANYVVDTLGRDKLDVVMVEMDHTSGRLNRDGCPLQEQAQQPGAVLLVLASPSLLRTMITYPAMQFDNLIPQQTPCPPMETSGVEGSAAQSPIPAVLFLCGTTSSDFDNNYSGNRKLSERFKGLDRWTTVSHEQSERLAPVVVHLMEGAKKNPSKPRGGRVDGSGPKKGREPKKLPSIKIRQKLDFAMLPSEVNCEEQTMVVLSFDHAVADSENDLKMAVEIVWEDADAPMKVVVRWLNVQTVFFQAPPHPAGRATVRVFFRGRDIGCRPLVYRSTSLEANVGIVQILLHQLSTLCDLLVVEKRLPDVSELDRMLSDVFQVDSPPIVVPTVVYEKFFDMYRLQNSVDSRVVLPTPIHLAAKYGFNELASKLIDLPDARSAYSITNVDGHYPEELARIAGHGQLGTVLQNFREVESDQENDDLVDDELGEVDGDVKNDVRDGDDDEYVAPEGEGFAQIYAAYVTSSTSRQFTSTTDPSETEELYLDMGQQNSRTSPTEELYLDMEQQQKKSKKVLSEELYLDMGGSRKGANADESIYDEDYVEPDSGPDGGDDDDDGSDYESVKSPEWLLPFGKHNKLPIPRPVEADNEGKGESEEMYLDMTKKPKQTPKKRPVNIPVRPPKVGPRPDAPVPRLSTASRADLPREAIRSSTAAASEEHAASAASESCSQKELLKILQQVKQNELTMAQAEILFQEWQMRYQSGKSKSFKQKQQQLEQMREEMKQVEDQSMIGSFLKNFGIGSTTKKGVKSRTTQANTVSTGRAVGVVNPTQIRVAAGGKTAYLSVASAVVPGQLSDRSSTASTSSRDSTASRASTTSGIDIDEMTLTRLDEESQKNSSPPTPPVPSRMPISKLVAYPMASLQGGVENPALTEVDKPSEVASSMVQRHGHFSPPMVTQKTLPEMSYPPQYDTSKLRKQSLPVIPPRSESPQLHKVKNSKTPAAPPSTGQHRLQVIPNLDESEVPQKPLPVTPRAK